MLVRLENHEWKIVGRGVLTLFACIILGTVVVEIQLNQLTYWQEIVQVFNIRRVSQGAYLAYVLGDEYYLQAAWQVGMISNTSQSLQFSIAGFGFSLPTKMEFDAAPVKACSLYIWNQGIEAAFSLKQLFGEYCK